MSLSLETFTQGLTTLSTRAVTQGSLSLETVTQGLTTLSTRAVTQGSPSSSGVITLIPSFKLSPPSGASP